MSILITGGCGYIGGHVVRQLSEAGEKVIVLDNLSTGDANTLLYGETLINMNLSDTKGISQILKDYSVDSIFHFAAFIIVPESVTNPAKYYLNNSQNTLNLINSCVEAGVKNFVFSSTAAVYGFLESGIAVEDSPTSPINPYGNSKLISEIMLKDIALASSMKYVILRYFNVAGAEPKGRMGQRIKDATHLIKVCCQVATGQKEYVQIFGSNYNTPDGTCIRDYIHVEDLAEAHLKALTYLQLGGASNVFNLGYGNGYSVKEVIEATKKVSGNNFKVINTEPRNGDPAILIAKADKAKSILNWEPKFNNLETIIQDALNWELLLQAEMK